MEFEFLFVQNLDNIEKRSLNSIKLGSIFAFFNVNFNID